MTNALGLLFGTIFPQLTASLIRNITYSYRYTYTFCLAHHPPPPQTPFRLISLSASTWFSLSHSVSLSTDRNDFILPHKCFLFFVFLFLFFLYFLCVFFHYICTFYAAILGTWITRPQFLLPSLSLSLLLLLTRRRFQYPFWGVFKCCQAH